MKKMLIVYYSWSNGNTERVAKALQVAAACDMVKLETVEAYSGGYDAVVQQGQQEVERGFQPEIKPLGVKLAEYDVVAIGTPTWWYTMAPAVLTFIKGQNWSGKTVVPFMTNGGWPGHVIEDIEVACAGASFGPSLEVKFDSGGGDRMETDENVIQSWTEQVKQLL